MARPVVVIGFLGTTLDRGAHAHRWERWRPTIDLCRQADLVVARLELLHDGRHGRLLAQVVEDLGTVSPETEVVPRAIDHPDPWDFEQVFAALHELARAYPFDPEREDYLVHVTTGSHVAQICLFLLTESRHFPARLVQCAYPRGGEPVGGIQVIDLDLSRFDVIASRFREEARAGVSLLKAGIETRNAAFNRTIDRIEQVALVSRDPILLTGPTGAGKSALARRIYDLKRARNQIAGRFVPVNCATLRGDQAMSALFGHQRGAYTGAASDRAGLLRAADGGVLFLDEVGELGADEQAMLLGALEEKRFLPVGADVEAESDFLLIAGTNRDLAAAVVQGSFREDLLARIDLWTFRLPGLSERREDIAPNLDYELGRWTERTGRRVAFNREAREAYERFATSSGAAWRASFRDLNGSVTRMATLAAGGRIDRAIVEEETGRLSATWAGARATAAEPGILEALLGAPGAAALDRFDRAQLEDVVRACRESRSLSDAGRALFAESRKRKATANDADRLRKYLARFGLSWEQIVRADPA